MKYKNCRNCGHPNPMDNRFCPECGTPFKNMVHGNAKDKKQEHKPKQTILIVLLAAIASIFLVILLCRPDTGGHQVAKSTETACTHVWIPANCLTPMRCGECGKTNGVANGHKWIEATCTAPKICEVCGLESGKAMGHQWTEATCTAPKMCEICGLESGAAMGHQWAEATYNLPKTCVVCHAQEGEPLENPLVELLRDNLPIVTYAMGSSRIIYGYKDASLTQKSNFGYIDSDIDEILITDISQDGLAVEVSYPSSAKASGYDVGWFPLDEIISLESIDIKYVKSGEATQTFRLSYNSLVPYGVTAPRYYLGSHASGYYMILYKIDDVKLFGLNVYSKIALVEARP